MHDTFRKSQGTGSAIKNCNALWENRPHSVLATLLAILLVLGLTGCGGGGGSATASASAPFISATLISFPAGSVPTGFNINSMVQVQDNSTGSPITNASVVMNGVALVYNSADKGYEGEVVVAAGAEVTLSVTVGGVTYRASAAQSPSYPTISAPAAGANWAANQINTVAWSGGDLVANSVIGLGVLDAANPEGQLVWPGDNSIMIMPANTNSYYIPANSLPTGTSLVLVGTAKMVEIPGAASRSGLVISGFNCARITVTNVPVATLLSIAVTPQGPTVTTGRSLQLTATGNYSDGSTLDLTAQVDWSSSDSTRATVSATGQVSGVASGAARFTANKAGLSGTTLIHVFQPTPSPSPPLSQAVAYQIDYAHTGYAYFGSTISFPGSATWATTLNGSVSYPLIADGKVFVTTSRSGVADAYGTSLYALDEQTGAVAWGPVALSGTYFWSGHAYDGGKLFVVNFDGLLRSFDAATGQPGWSIKLPGQYAFSAAPTAVNGVVYLGGAGSGGTLYAVDESDGRVIWTSAVENGDQSSPAVASDGVFVSYPCQVYKFDPFTGATLWHSSGGCEGGGGRTTVYTNGLLYVRDATPGQILNATTGSVVGSFTATPIPAFSAQSGFFQSSGTLTGIDLGTHNVLWNFAGDGGLVSAPIVVGPYVIVGSNSGNVYAVNAVTGALVWSGRAAAAIYGPDEQNVSQPLTGLGAGEGYLVVPGGNTLTAWRLAGP